jgi:hypothetical protein
MRFRGRTPATPSLSGRDRARVAWLALALILVLIAIQVAADPATWAWLFPREAEHDPGQPAPNAAALDEFVVDLDEGPPGVPQPARSDGAIIDRASLVGVRDFTLNLRASERGAYFAVLTRLRELENLTLEAAADPAATYAVVTVEPDLYRGRAITIEGVARRILDMPAGENDAGFETLHELWVFTPESGNDPWRVVTTELPAELPRGEFGGEGIPVRITGIFFKTQGYETQRGELNVAPLLLAKTAHRLRSPGVGFNEADLVPWVLGGATILAAGLIFLLWRFRREDRAFERTTLRRFTGASPEAVAAIPEVERDDPQEFFKQLEQSDKPENS